MKKNYQKPDMTVVLLKTRGTLLVESVGAVGLEEHGGYGGSKYDGDAD